MKIENKKIIGRAFVAVTFFALTSTHFATSSVAKEEGLQNKKIRTEISKELSETEKNRTDRQKTKYEIEKIKAETEQIKSNWRFFWQIILPSLTVPVAALGAIITWRNQIEENKLTREGIENENKLTRERIKNEEKEKLEQKLMNAMKSILTDSLDLEVLGLLLLSDLIKHKEYQDPIYDLLINKIIINKDKNIKANFSLLRLFEKALELKLNDQNSLLPLLALSELILDEIRFFKINLTHSDFTKASLRKAKFINLKIKEKVTFQEANLESAELRETHFYNVNCVSTKFYNININNGSFNFPDRTLTQQLQESHFTQGTLKETKFNESNLTGVIFKQTKIEKGEFNNSIFSKTSFINATINNTTFNSCQELVEVNFNYASLNEVTFEKVIIHKSSTFNGTIFKKTKFTEVTIDDVDFSKSTFDNETLENIAQLKNWHKANFKEDHKNLILVKQTLS
jgi:uncharacterized protein YjbI with pentapeptide repeats